MRQRTFGRCGFDVSELTLGTWGLSGDGYGVIFYREVDRVIDRAIEHGITLFETADVYGRGEMETKLGERLDPEKHRVVTKIGTFRPKDEGPAEKRFDVKSLEEALDKCHERLKRETLDVVMLHCPSVSAVQRGEATGFLEERIGQGKLKAWGVSAGSVAVASAALEANAQVVQMVYNLTRPMDLHLIADQASMCGAALLARSVLAHGLLTRTWPAHRVFASYDHRYHRWTEAELRYRLEQLEPIDELVDELGDDEVATLRSAALRFVLGNDLVTSAVIGPRSTIQLDQLVEDAGDGPPYLPDALMSALPSALADAGIPL